ncbi:MAG: type IV-A pilus assembly ATPase PilB [Planctomycetes bacterium]|nr:type IV-A pilus assembly ATPase PilB [Planctomycetota bacterium]
MKSSAAKFNKRIVPILTRFKLVAEQDVSAVLSEKGDNASVTETLIDAGKLDQGKFLCALAKETGLPPVDVNKLEPQKDLLELLPENLAKYYGVLPVARIGRMLSLAVSNPYDIVKLDDIAMVTSCTIKPVLSTDFAIKKAIPGFYDRGGQMMKDLIDNLGEQDIDLQQQEEEADEGAGDLAVEGEESPVVKLVNLIIYQAIRDKASDIHVEPYEKQILVRYRMDGVLKEVMRPPVKLINPLVSRVKIMSGLDIAERRVPQDGKFQLRVDGRQIDFRVSTLPMIHGEKVVMRILDSSNLSLDLEALGFEPKALQDIAAAIAQPYGMILVTGPTGSGKSTTLYSCIRAVLSPEDNIVTVEDPVEYQLEGVNQVPVNVKRGLTFAAALRSILRQDPDTILIGEIRDLETAEIAIKAALTGHLVFSTLHTNDAPSSVTRLVDMGVDAFLVASSVHCIAAQRLARRLCDDCKKPLADPPPRERLVELGFTKEDLATMKLHGAVGCNRCSAGYRGRFAILETLPLSEEIRRLVINGKSAIEIKEAAVRAGMISLRRCGILNVIRGKTSLEEILRVTMND